MQGLKRRIVYISAFEGLAIVLSAIAFAFLFHASPFDAGGMSIAASVIAMLWNLAYNAGFEWWESRQSRRGRGLARRIAHTVGFEFGLLFALVPMFAVWLGISLWDAFVLDFGMVLFFLVYTFLFNLGFDRIFGLPASAA